MSAVSPIASKLYAPQRKTRSANNGPMRCSKTVSLFDHVVGAREQERRHVEAKSPRGLQVNRQLEFGGCLHRKIRWFGALKDAVNITRRSCRPANGRDGRDCRPTGR